MGQRGGDNGREVQEGEDICILTTDLGFPGGSDGKESACSAGDLGLIPVSGRSSGEGNGYPLQYSFFFFFHSSILAWIIPWTWSLVGYSPRDCKRVGHD